MEKTSNKMPMVLSVALLIVLAIIAYFLLTDSNGVRSSVLQNNTSNEVQAEAGSASTYTGFALTEGQKQALISAGVDAGSVPDSVSPAQEQCLVEFFGEARVTEIRNGAIPSNYEFMRAKPCL